MTRADRKLASLITEAFLAAEEDSDVEEHLCEALAALLGGDLRASEFVRDYLSEHA